MKILAVFRKSMIESIRDYWTTLMTIAFPPFFVLLYVVMYSTTDTVYKVLVVDEDLPVNGQKFSALALQECAALRTSSGLPTLQVTTRRDTTGLRLAIQNRAADAVISIPRNYSLNISLARAGKPERPSVTAYGDATNPKYMTAVIFAITGFENAVSKQTNSGRLLGFNEVFVGSSGKINDFTIAVPGLIVFAIIMLLYTAAGAVVREVENRTIFRLNLSRLNTFEFLTGITLQQTVIGAVTILVTILTAVAFGFKIEGSFAAALTVCLLLIISIVAISLLTAGFCKTMSNVLTIGTVPLFILMWFTGAMYPMPMPELFTVAGRAYSFNALLPPTFGVTALNKIFIHGAGLGDIWFELSAIAILTTAYYILGLWVFNRLQRRAM